MYWLNSKSSSKVKDDDVIALIDQDFLFIRPLINKIKGEPNILHNYMLSNKFMDVPEMVKKGQAVGQLYDINGIWANDRNPHFNRTYVCGKNSPCLLINERYASQYYSIGSPFILVKSDWIRLVKTWTKFSPLVYETSHKYTFMTELHAYGMAAAHEKLPHFQLHNLMISNSKIANEGWPLVDKLNDYCLPPMENGIFYPNKVLPTFLHYCQEYSNSLLGVTFYKKRNNPKTFFSCNSSMLPEFNDNVGTMVSY